MRLDREILLEKSINQLVELCLKLNSDNGELRTRVANLQKEKSSKEVKETNKQLRAENKKLQATIDKIKANIG